MTAGRHTETSAELFDHGILSEHSDIRAHVSVVGKCVYVFPTKNGIAAVHKFHPVTRTATQPGVTGPTANGWLVKPCWIDDIRCIQLSGEWPQWSGWEESLTTTEKGKRAVSVIVTLLARGRFPLWVIADDDKRQNVQIMGTDIVVFCNQRIQVKCDYKAGDKPGCTGNLYLQFSERNPLKRH